VGTISAHKKQRDDNFYTLQVLLATDFSSLQHVRIIKNYKQKEQLQVEQEAKRND
jgi:rod shape-determining protein MreC